MPTVLLICGKQGSGKSTLTKILCDKLDRAYPLKFAGPLYDVGYTVYSLLNKNYGMELLPSDPAFKRLLQLVGTEWGRAMDDQIWVKCAQNKVNNPTAHPDNIYIFDDCRFENELDAFPGAIAIRLYAAEDARRARTDRWREDVDHPSETGLDHIPDGVFAATYCTGYNGTPATEIADAIIALLKGAPNAQETGIPQA